MKISAIIVSGLIAGALTAAAAHAGSLRIYNNDSKEYEVKVKCSGSSSSFKVRASTTATYTFHSTASSCDIDGGDVSFPNKEIKDGEKYTIKGGKAKTGI